MISAMQPCLWHTWTLKKLEFRMPLQAFAPMVTANCSICEAASQRIKGDHKGQRLVL